MKNSIQAAVRYLKDDNALAVYRASTAGGELVPHEGNYVDHTVTIENARDSDETLTLDGEGFRLIEQHTNVKDFYDSSQLPLYETELTNALSRLTGSTDVLVFDHTRRSSSNKIRTQKKIREASTVIHNDYSANSGHVRLSDFLNDHPELSSEKYSGRPFAIINVWRSIAGTILNYPLSMCFATSVHETDLVPIKREGKERIGEIQLVLYREQHRWGYFPCMTSHEALVFKTFDSRIDGRTRFTPHTSINDPAAPADAPPRESIESRCFVFF